MRYSERRSPSKPHASSRSMVRDLYDVARDASSRTHGSSSRDLFSGASGHQTLGAVEGGAAALLTGIVAGRYGTANIPGTSIPGGLTVGAAGMAAALFGFVPRKYADHVFASSAGMFNAWMGMYGLGLGQDMAEKAGAPTGTVGIAGLPGGVGCSPSVGCPPNAGAPQMGRAAMGPVTPYRGYRRSPLTEAEITGLYARSA